jgi:hypothetical protein
MRSGSATRCLLAVVVEEAQVDPFGHLGEHREVGADPVEGRAERVTTLPAITPDEEAAAARADVSPEAAESYKEYLEKAKNVEGEGRIP